MPRHVTAKRAAARAELQNQRELTADVVEALDEALRHLVEEELGAALAEAAQAVLAHRARVEDEVRGGARRQLSAAQARWMRVQASFSASVEVA